jgi:hypothetical protein
VRGQLEVQIRRLVDRPAGFHSAADGDRAPRSASWYNQLRGLASVSSSCSASWWRPCRSLSALREIYSARHGAALGQPPAERQAAAAGAVDRRRHRPRRHLRRRVRRGTGRSAPPRRAEDCAERFARGRPTTGLNMRRIGADDRRCRISASTASISAG